MKVRNLDDLKEWEFREREVKGPIYRFLTWCALALNTYILRHFGLMIAGYLTPRYKAWKGFHLKRIKS